MDLVRIGNKLISSDKVKSVVDDILDLRVQGFSQHEVGRKMGVDRSFVSKMEKIGEIRKGGRVAVIGFPVKNKEELEEALNELGVEYRLLFTNEERWTFVEGFDGVELFNRVMKIITDLRGYDTVVVIGSNYRIKLCEALLDKDVIGVEIGKSPIADDKYVPVSEIKDLIRSIMKE